MKVAAMNNFNIPILFLVFNRLDTTRRVFERIREAAPEKLYIASDGPRGEREGEDEKVRIVREYVIKSIDWNCEVKTLLREKNLGCGKAVSQAITWFFENEEMGIVLEDDCLPSVSFFPYCKELLEKYKDDTRIYQITGYNLLTYTKMPYSYSFARLHHCWGWATWKRAWSQYNFDIINLDNFFSEKKIDAIFDRKIDRHYWLNIFKKMEKHEVDTWDYQWTYTIFNNKGICIYPAKNLVTNIGFRSDATHTNVDDPKKNNQQQFIIEKIKHPKKIVINVSLDSKINKLFTGTDLPLKHKIKMKVKKIIKRFLIN